MTNLLYRRGVLLKDVSNFMSGYRVAIRQRAQDIAEQSGIEIEFVLKSTARKEDIVQRHLLERRKKLHGKNNLELMTSCKQTRQGDFQWRIPHQRIQKQAS